MDNNAEFSINKMEGISTSNWIELTFSTPVPVDKIIVTQSGVQHDPALVCTITHADGKFFRNQNNQNILF